MTHPLFAPDIKFDEPYWWETAAPPEEREPALPARVDVAIVGGGYTGLSAALTCSVRGERWRCSMPSARAGAAAAATAARLALSCAAPSTT